MLDRAAITARIPHAGKMCLLERVVDWDERSIRCTALSHRDMDNPLREAGGLPVWAGIEYAAQAAAVHGALIKPEAAPRTGVLAALRRVNANCEWLDRIDGELTLGARLLHADTAGGIYGFEVHGNNVLLLSGQFTLMFPDATRVLQKGSQ
jgi:predicted hotdog family 3-hydroxylacyl-ACP dehydratase